MQGNMMMCMQATISSRVKCGAVLMVVITGNGDNRCTVLMASK
jgi:hypothetical protein